ncbi:hypothetical protein LTR37_001948 [Vermiconidia calcicola]|uniref:Uncharacterized protein n=1 Tax=Vermiconidia calcicola TaxID=1690605 RepID=A0ACC3NV40_9PEZI|nr:hypothetical protein LTR37_001948 [Vermiconidia calcicola]
MTQYGPVGDFPVSGKIVAVTGGGSGIGFAFAKACHSKGARIVIGDLKLTDEAEQYVSKASDEIVFQKCDVTSWDDLHDLISFSVEKFQAAGIYEPSFSNFWDDESGSYKTMRINVDHPVKFTRLAMRALAGAEKQGVVTLVASTAGIRANYLACLYTASKHAIVGFAKAMGQADIDEGVRINAILPGLVSSPLWHDRDDNMMEWGKFDGRKQLQPSDIGDLMLRMVESKEYEGGTCVLKTPYEEKIQEEGHRKMVEKLKEYDPSPRPEAGLDRIKDVLQKERGKKWT